MKVVIAGGSGNVGLSLIRHLATNQSDIFVLARKNTFIENAKTVAWDGESLGAWVNTLNGADVVINLAGRSVNCRYNNKNLSDMMTSRVNSTRVIGQAIASVQNPPKIWLQASTATIYAHRYDKPNDEYTGILGGDEPQAPRLWNESIAIAKAWEEELNNAETPRTRKIAMRSAMTMSIDEGSVFRVLLGLARKGLGGKLGNGNQFVSWIHEDDFAAAVMFLIQNETLQGAVNICSPNPLPQAQFMHELRLAAKVRFAINAPTWMVEIGTWLMKTESELVLKSRRVIPTRLLESGFQFRFPYWPDAATDLVNRTIKSTH